MDYVNIRYEKNEGIGHLVINRPEKRNALNTTARKEMLEALADADGDPRVKTLVLSGAGGKSFMAGSDLTELSRFSPIEMESFTASLGGGFYRKFEEMDKPVIAMIDGLCLGGGLELALSCDIRIASEKSRFGQPEILIGIMPGSGGTQRLTRLVGAGKAKELILTGTMIDASEALSIGLVNRLVPSEELEGVVMAVARKIAEQSPLALKWAKRAINAAQETNLSAGLSYECLAECLLFSSKDREEGMKAFFEKRKPIFKGE